MLYGAPSSPVIKARRLLFVMPVTAHSVLARAPPRAMTRGSPNRSPGALRPSWVRVGCDIRAKAGLSKTHPWPTLSVSSSRELIARARAWSSGRLCRRRATPRASGELTTVSTRSARPSFRYCFTLECRQKALMVTPWLLRSMVVLNVPPVGLSERHRDACHPPVEERLYVTRAEPVADGLQPGRVGAGREAVGQLGEADPGACRCPLGMLMAVQPDLDRVGEVRADLDEPRPPPLVPDIEVVAGHAALGLGEGELRGPGRVGVALARIPHQLELLRPADRHHPGPLSLGGVPQVALHDVDLADALLELDDRDVVHLGVPCHRLAEASADLLEHRRGSYRHAAVIVQERQHLTAHLQHRHVTVEVDAVQALDVQHRVTV